MLFLVKFEQDSYASIVWLLYEICVRAIVWKMAIVYGYCMEYGIWLLYGIFIFVVLFFVLPCVLPFFSGVQLSIVKWLLYGIWNMAIRT